MPIKRFILLLIILLGQASLAIAGPRVAIFSDETTTSRQIHQLVSEELRQAGLPELAVGTITSAQKAAPQEPAASAPPTGTPGISLGMLNPGDIAIAIGSQALRHLLHQSTSRQIIVVLITRSALEEELTKLATRAGREIYAIVLDQPLGRFLDLMRLALPQRQRIGVLLGPTTSTQQKPLERLAAERDMTVSVSRVYEDVIFIPQLERLLVQSDILLALPDASVHNRNTVQPLLLTTYRAGVPVVAYSEGYAQAGALLALYSTPAQLARQTIEVVQNLSQGRSAPHIQAPRYFSVSVNASVARSLGLTLPAADVLRERLQQISAGVEKSE